MRTDKIRYFMSRDTRVMLDNLSKVVIDGDMVVIEYTVFMKDFNDITFTAVRYSKSKKTMIIYDELKKYNANVYGAFIEWANEKGLELLKAERKYSDDICVVCGDYVAEGAHVCNNCRRDGDAYEE